MTTAEPLRLADLRLVPPTLPTAILASWATELYGLTGQLERLQGERDQNHRLTAPDGQQYVLKVSSALEDPATVDFQTKALLHLADAAPELPVPRVLPTLDGDHLTPRTAPDGATHVVRLLTYLPGISFEDGEVSPTALLQIGRFQGRLCRALADFRHPAAHAFMPWDLNNGLLGTDALWAGASPATRRQLDPVRGHLVDEVLPALAELRTQVIHNDAHRGNLLRPGPDSDRLVGLIDFGDLVHSSLAADLASSAASFVDNGADPAAGLVGLTQGFHEAIPLHPEELQLLPDLVLARLALAALVFDLRIAAGGDDADAVAAVRTMVLDWIATWLELDSRRLADRLATTCTRSPRSASPVGGVTPVLDRRRRALHPGYFLSYDRPLHLVRGEGAWLFDADGRSYLDCYNNVPSVGHCHPRVVEAISRQAQQLNTHTRYLHENVVRLAERLAALLPGDLDRSSFVCTGTEANDLAVQMARAATGHDGVVVSEGSYHGNSTLVRQLSTIAYPADERPPWLGAVEPPNLYRGRFRADEPDAGARYATLVSHEIEELAGRGHQLAAFVVDSIWDSNGVLVPPDDYLPRVVEAVHAAGGLVVADEVQAGHGRTGRWWGVEAHGITPDIVTMGKGMGNGHPVAAVVTTTAIGTAFAEQVPYFNTFGGNPVSAAAALAVLDVIEDEGLLANAEAVGGRVGDGLRELAGRHEVIGDVRGRGLFWGIELVGDRGDRRPLSPEATQSLVTDLAEAGLLVGVSGPDRNVLKFRPPLVFGAAEADRALEILDRELGRLTPG